MTISINGVVGTTATVDQGSRVEVFSDATTILWGIAFQPETPNGTYSVTFVTSGLITSANLTDYIDVNLAGTYVISYSEDGGAVNNIHIESLGLVASSKVAFPGETFEMSASAGWARKVENSINGAAQVAGAEIYWCKNNPLDADLNLGDLVGIDGIYSTIIPGYVYYARARANLDVTEQKKLGIVVRKVSDNNAGFNYVVLFSGASLVDAGFTLAVDSYNSFYYDIGNHALTDHDGERYVGKYLVPISGKDIVFIQNPIYDPSLVDTSGSFIYYSVTNADILAAIQALGAGHYTDPFEISLGKLPNGFYVEEIRALIREDFYTSDAYGAPAPGEVAGTFSVGYTSPTRDNFIELDEIPTASLAGTDFTIYKNLNVIAQDPAGEVEVFFRSDALAHLNITYDGFGVPNTVMGAAAFYIYFRGRKL